jgi:hypothetical protein
MICAPDLSDTLLAVFMQKKPHAKNARFATGLELFKPSAGGAVLIWQGRAAALPQSFNRCAVSSASQCRLPVWAFLAVWA